MSYSAMVFTDSLTVKSQESRCFDPKISNKQAFDAELLSTCFRRYFLFADWDWWSIVESLSLLQPSIPKIATPSWVMALQIQCRSWTGKLQPEHFHAMRPRRKPQKLQLLWISDLLQSQLSLPLWPLQHQLQPPLRHPLRHPQWHPQWHRQLMRLVPEGRAQRGSTRRLWEPQLWLRHHPDGRCGDQVIRSC